MCDVVVVAFEEVYKLLFFYSNLYLVLYYNFLTVLTNYCMTFYFLVKYD